jgi:L-alanine-DL-glutamate epimerase-like enolase superfamily enzyme
MKIADVRDAGRHPRAPAPRCPSTLEAVNCFVRLEAADGQVGWGEAACLGGPTWSEESAESVAAIVEHYITPWLRGSEATGIEAVSREMARRVQGNPFARAAVEMALWDLNARALGVPVHRLLGGRVRDRVPLSWSLAVADHDAEIEEARAKVAAGHRIFKVKTGAVPWVEDVARVRKLREALGREIELRVDANQAGSTDGARPSAGSGLRPRLRRAAVRAGIWRAWRRSGAGWMCRSWRTSPAAPRTTPSRWRASGASASSGSSSPSPRALPAASPSPASPRPRD